MAKKTIIFDFDGVILDSFKVALSILQSLHVSHKLKELSSLKLKDLFDGNVWENYEKEGVKGELKQRFINEFKKEYALRKNDLKLFKGVKECLRTLSIQYKLVIISSNHSEAIKEMLVHEGLILYFSQILGAEIPGNKKSKIINLMQSEGISPSDIYFVSDTKGDIKEVEGISIHAIAVTWGYHSRDRLLPSSAEIVVNTPEELLQYFNNEI